MQIFDEFLFSFGLGSDFLPNEYDGEIYHYTSSSAFQSILFEGERSAVLWASRYDCLNDISEGRAAEVILREVSLELREQNKICEELYQLCVAARLTPTILVHREVDGELIFSSKEYDRFICSFSKKSDSLSMWNYYAKGNMYEGFNIGFDCGSIKESLIEQFRKVDAVAHIYPVVYDPAEQRQRVANFLQSINKYYSDKNASTISELIADCLVNWSLIFKQACFQHEEEVRIIVDLAKDETNIITQYRIYAGYVIPYIKLKIEKEAVSSVCFGPLSKGNELTESQEKIMEGLLTAKGYHCTCVSRSKIPIRY